MILICRRAYGIGWKAATTLENFAKVMDACMRTCAMDASGEMGYKSRIDIMVHPIPTGLGNPL